MNKVVFSSFICFLILTACETNSSDKKVESSVVAEDQSEKDRLAEIKALEEEEANKIKLSTSFSVDKKKHDFGTIQEDTENNVSFTLTNTGQNPLIIESVDVSCGCTTAKKPEKPIAPGQSDKIEVIFHPKPGQLDKQHKTITITANTDPKITTLEIEAFVEAK